MNKLLIPLLIVSVFFFVYFINSADFVERGPDPKVYFSYKDNLTRVYYDLVKESNDIKCALYDLDNPVLIAALQNANADITMEEDNAIDGFHYGQSYALMHNKFCIFDNRIVLTGSFNPTIKGDLNNNNVFVIESKNLAKNYLDEFNELKSEIYGGGAITKNSLIKYNGFIIKNYFCPEDSCKKHVIDELQKAKESIYFMVFSFTDNDIANVLLQKHNFGLNISGVMEKQRINMKYNRFKFLNSSGVKVYPDKNKYYMHHKVFIIDEKTVIFGSYNPTGAGNTKNDENIIIIENKDIARAFMEEYQSLIL